MKTFSRFWVTMVTIVCVSLPMVSLSQPGSSGARAPDDDNWLSTEEKAWLANHPIIPLAVDGNYPPLDFFDDAGNHRGLLADYLEILGSQLGVEFVAQPRSSFKSALSALIDGRAYAGAPIARTAEREKDLLFTRPFISLHKVIIAAEEYRDIQGVGDLDNRVVAVEDGFITMHQMRDGYPNIFLQTYDTTLEALEAVSWSRADFYIGNQSVASWLMRDHQLTNLRVISKAGLPLAAQHFVVSKKHPSWVPLVNILNKALENISYSERARLEQNWLFHPGYRINLSDEVDLSAEEKAWVFNNPIIYVANEEGMAPLQFSESGEARGYVVDFTRLAAEKVGLQIEFVNKAGGEELYTWGQKRKIDVFPALSQQQREDNLLFSDPYLTLQQALVVRKSSHIENLENLSAGTLVVVKGDPLTPVLKSVYPHINTTEVSALHEALRAVSFGRADALVAPLTLINYTIRSMSIPGLNVINQYNLDPRLHQKLYMGISTDQPLLGDILQKGIKTITATELAQLEEKWFKPVSDSGLVQRDGGIRWWLVATIAVLLVILIFSAIFLSRVFFQENLIISFGSRDFRTPFLIAGSVVVSLVALLIFITLEQNKRQVLESVEVNLGVTLKNTVERLDSWAADRIGHLERLAQDAEFLSLAKILLAERHDSVSLQATFTRVRMTQFLVERQADWSRGDIFLINLDNLSVIAPQGYDVGKPNFISQLRPGLMDRAKAGKPVFIPFVPSDVIDDSQVYQPVRNSLSFFAVPVIDAEGEVIAVLAQSLSTDDAFMRILRHGRIGSSGESYALDASGRLLSESRFREQLIRVGLVEPNSHESNQVEIRDPGGDLTTGHKSAVPRGLQPLTRMAEDVIRLGADNPGGGLSPLVTDVSKYRDYRGVPVFGAWLWDFDLGVGIATEIDVNEAMEAHRWLSVGLSLTAVILMSLFIFAMVFTLTLGEKVMLTLRRSRDELEMRVNERTQQLADSESKYRSLFELSKDAIMTLAQNHFINCNQAAVTMFGFEKKEDLLRLQPIDLSPKQQPDGRDSFTAAIALFETAIEKGFHLSEWTNRRRNGEAFSSELLITHMQIDGHPLFQVTLRDISERKAFEVEQKRLLEEADAANKAKSDFLANMSHEIRTPMNAIIGLGHLLYRTPLDSKQSDYVKKVQNSAHSLLGIIDDILDFSKIEAGQLKIERIEFSLDDVLGNLATLATTRIADRPIEFIYNIGSGIPPRLVGDPFRLGQILTNLVTNAIKFTNRGNIILRVSEDHIENQYTLMFEVEDNGIGISKDNLEHLFDPFTQADGSTTRRYGGTGLGLSICKQLTEMMGGSIGVESELGRGSRFYFDLPFRKGTELQLPLPDPDLRGMKVLLIDDNPTALKILSETLTSLSFEVDIAYSGVEALKKLERYPERDLILVDWLMPGMDGKQTVERIKSDSRVKDVPIIIMMTAYGREAVEQNLDKSDLDGFLVKPVTPSQLFDAIIQAKHAADDKRPAPISYHDNHSQLSGRILLAEDNQINQQVAVEILEKMGLDVRVCDNGVQAVDSVLSSRPDLILMDIQMPVMDGYEATRQIRKMEGTSSLPIFAMTANAMQGDEEKSRQAGMDGHITKPVDPTELYTVLRKWLPDSAANMGKLELPTEVSSDTVSIPAPEEKPALYSGLDTEKGVKRVGGNRPLYEKLLRDFQGSYKNAPETLSAYLTEGDTEAAYRLTHTLSGVCANIGAKRLAQVAREIEHMLRSKTDIDPSTTTRFTQASNELFANITDFLNTHTEKSPESVASQSEVSAKLHTLADLLDALSSGDPGSKMIFDQTQVELRNILPESHIIELQKEIEEFEFDAAARMLKQIMEK